MPYLKNKYAIILCISLLLFGCASVPEQELISECEEVKVKEARFVCYQEEIRDLIKWNIDNAVSGNPIHYSRTPRRIILSITLLSTGRVDKVKTEKSSGNFSFDMAVERAIKQSGPFFLPKDPVIRKPLLNFPFSIGFR